MNEGRPTAADDRLRQIVGRACTQRLIDVRKMLAVELVEFAVVGRMVLRAVPPVPVAAFGDQDFFKGQFALLLGGSRRRPRS